MASVNKFSAIGRLTADPESRDANGNQITTFTIAIDRYGKDKKADFFRCTAFGTTAGFVKSYITKGQMVYVDGRIQVDNVEKDGVTKTYVSVPVTTVQSLSSKAENESRKTEPDTRPSQESLYGDDDEDPFGD